MLLCAPGWLGYWRSGATPFDRITTSSGNRAFKTDSMPELNQLKRCGPIERVEEKEGGTRAMTHVVHEGDEEGGSVLFRTSLFSSC
jgi:hypothetical protein